MSIMFENYTKETTVTVDEMGVYTIFVEKYGLSLAVLLNTESLHFRNFTLDLTIT